MEKSGNPLEKPATNTTFVEFRYHYASVKAIESFLTVKQSSCSDVKGVLFSPRTVGLSLKHERLNSIANAN